MAIGFSDDSAQVYGFSTCCDGYRRAKYLEKTLQDARAMHAQYIDTFKNNHLKALHMACDRIRALEQQVQELQKRAEPIGIPGNYPYGYCTER